MECDLLRLAGPDLDLPRQASRVALQATVRNVQDQVPGREGPDEWIFGDGRRGGLGPIRVSDCVLSRGMADRVN